MQIKRNEQSQEQEKEETANNKKRIRSAEEELDLQINKETQQEHNIQRATTKKADQHKIMQETLYR